MPDFRVSDTAAEHPKLRAAGLAAAGLWAMAGSWSMSPANLTDGWIPAYWVASWPSGRRHAQRLVKLGLWVEEERDGKAGYQFHDWLQYQRSKSSVDEDRAKARDRMARRRSRERSPEVRANTPVDNLGTSPSAESSDDQATGKRRSRDGQAMSKTKTDRPPVDNSATSGKGSKFGRTSGERSAEVRQPPSPSPSPSNHLGGEGSPPGQASNDQEPPPPRCPDHIEQPAPGPCGACADARRRVEAWQAEQDARRAELAAALDRARVDPRLRCEHGTDAGLYVRPDTGTSPCALCRAEQPAEAQA